MSTFPELQRNISYKNYLINILAGFFIALLSSKFVLFPLFIGLFITIDTSIIFILSFLFFIETLHSFPYFSLILFYLIYKNYIYKILYIKFDKTFTEFLSIILVYLLYFLVLTSYYTIQDINVNFNISYFIYYIFIEEIILFLYKRVLK